MTLKQIHAMLEPGTVWDATNTYRDGADGRRTIVRRLTEQVVYSTPTNPKFWMTLPKAAQVIEARDGFLSFNLLSDADAKKYGKQGVITLTRVDEVKGETE